jgi:hypothetical protein
MTEDELFNDIVATNPGPDEMLFIGRVGKDFGWRAIVAGEPMATEIDGVPADAWMFSTLAWPGDADENEQRRFFDDFLAEVETMVDGPDRCRWEFDDPYGLRH